MSTTTEGRTAMLNVVSAAWNKLQSLIDSIPDTALEKPSTIGIWSGRDMVGHLAAWEEIGIRIVREMDERGEFSRLGINRDTVDAFNEEMMIPYRAMSTPEVRQALVDTHTALIRLAEASRADIDEIVIDVTRDHYAKHIPNLRGIPID
jgi:hypothetical protein